MRVPYDELKSEFRRVLLSRGFDEGDAEAAASIFADNSLDGVYSHGTNRFPRVVEYLDSGVMDPHRKAGCVSSFMAFERWDGHRGFGPLNARIAMDRACALADRFGIGIVALGNNNHWMRGGTYGWQAADKGYIAICWSNTMPNMPAWGAVDSRIGNNPFIIAVPRSDGRHIVVDCALSQFSYGKLEEARLAGRMLPVDGGYDSEGRLTRDPAEIEKTRRVLPMGYWKGSGLSIALDAVATVLTDGNSVERIGTFEKEEGLSQVMIAVAPGKMDDAALTDSIVSSVADYVNGSVPAAEGGKVYYPGQRSWETRRDNLEHGIPVVEEIWERIKAF